MTSQRQTKAIGIVVEWIEAPFYDCPDRMVVRLNLTITTTSFSWKIQFATTSIGWRIPTSTELNDSSISQEQTIKKTIQVIAKMSFEEKRSALVNTIIRGGN